MKNTLLDIWLTCDKIVGYDNIIEVFPQKSFRCFPPWIWVTFDAIIVVTKRSCAYTFSVSVVNFNYPKHWPLGNPFFTISPNLPWILTGIRTFAIKIYEIKKVLMGICIDTNNQKLFFLTKLRPFEFLAAYDTRGVIRGKAAKHLP